LLARDDKALLAELMIQALQADPLSSKALRHLLKQAGGAYTASGVADLLGIAGVRYASVLARVSCWRFPEGGIASTRHFSLMSPAARWCPPSRRFWPCSIRIVPRPSYAFS
jgi:hypothetical protein